PGRGDRVALMRLGALIDGLGETVRDVEVTGIATDSRAVRPGEAFFALPGLRTDGRRHVAEAVARGARVIVAEGEVAAKGGVPVVSVAAVRRVLAHAAARLAGEPSAGLTLVGVTGTNGKTSTTFILEAIWLAAGLRAGVIGTVGYRFAGLDRPAPLTTPEAPVLQGLLAEMRRAGTTQVAMEVSSHALAQVRVGRAEDADVRPLDIETTLAGTRGMLFLGGQRLPFRTRLVGAPQVENILGAAAAAWALGVPSEAIAAGLAAVAPPPGRLERF